MKETLCFFGDTLSTLLSPLKREILFYFIFFKKGGKSGVFRLLLRRSHLDWVFLSLFHRGDGGRKEEEEEERGGGVGGLSLSLFSFPLCGLTHFREEEEEEGCKDMRQRARTHTKESLTKNNSQKYIFLKKIFFSRQELMLSLQILHSTHENISVIVLLPLCLKTLICRHFFGVKIGFEKFFIKK